MKSKNRKLPFKSRIQSCHIRSSSEWNFWCSTSHFFLFHVSIHILHYKSTQWWVIYVWDVSTQRDYNSDDPRGIPRKRMLHTRSAGAKFVFEVHCQDLLSKSAIILLSPLNKWETKYFCRIAKSICESVSEDKFQLNYWRTNYRKTMTLLHKVYKEPFAHCMRVF